MACLKCKGKATDYCLKCYWELQTENTELKKQIILSRGENELLQKYADKTEKLNQQLMNKISRIVAGGGKGKK